jgi:hypothetical protein
VARRRGLSGSLGFRGFFLARLDSHVVADRAAGHGTEHGMVMRVMASHGTHNGAFETTGACRAGE